MTSTVPLALRNLPPFPPVAAKLIALLARRDTAFGEVARLLSSDAALSAEVLRMANSPFGGRYGTNSILQALSLIGVTRVSSLVVTLSVSRLLQRAARSPMLRRCWQHNLASALIAREFASEFSLDGEQAYMSGLLHDVGRLALIASDPAAYEAFPPGKNLNELEREHFGIDASQAASWLIGHWCFPEPYSEVARLHDDPLHSLHPVTNLIGVACHIASQIGFGFEDGQKLPDTLVLDDLRYRIASTINAFECELAA